MQLGLGLFALLINICGKETFCLYCNRMCSGTTAGNVFLLSKLSLKTKKKEMGKPSQIWRTFDELPLIIVMMGLHFPGGTVKHYRGEAPRLPTATLVQRRVGWFIHTHTHIRLTVGHHQTAPCCAPGHGVPFILVEKVNKNKTEATI